MRVSLDTNILIYAADATAEQRHSRAVDLINRATGADCVLTLQSLGEFYNVATRKVGLAAGKTESFVNAWRSCFPVHAASASCLDEAMHAVRRHRLPFWDAMLWAAAREAGCRLLLSEDFQDGLAIGGLRCVNPFAAANRALLEAALPSAD